MIHMEEIRIWKRLLEKTSPVDLLIHLGMLEGSEAIWRQSLPCPVEMVAGNNDFFSRLPRGEGHYDWKASDLYDAWP